MKNHIHSRINKIIEVNKLTVNSFAKKIDVAPTTLNSMFLKETNPSFEVLNKIINAFTDINTEWLITGEGNMLKDKSTPNTDINIPNQKDNNNETIKLLEDKIALLEKNNALIEENKQTQEELIKSKNELIEFLKKQNSLHNNDNSQSKAS